MQHLDPIFKTLAPGTGNIDRTPGREKVERDGRGGLSALRPSGAGHFVKMVHNGIEYGIMAAYAEGFNILKNANAARRPRVRRRNHAAAQPGALSVRSQPGRRCRSLAARQRSRLLAARSDCDRAARSTRSRTSRAASPIPAKAAGRCTAAIDESAPAPVLSAALYQRFSSRGEEISRTSCSRPCGSSLAATSRNAAADGKE